MLNTQVATATEQKLNFSCQAGEEIGYEKGAKMVKTHFDQNNEEMNHHFIGRDIIEAILAQPGATGITILPGIDQQGNAQPVLVGVNASGNYILNVTSVGPNGQLNKQQGIVATGVISPGTGTQTNDGCGWY
jgi:hypothetical protein